MRSRAVVVPLGTAPNKRPWERIPIEVRVELEGFEILEFDYRLADGEPRPRSLAPRGP